MKKIITTITFPLLISFFAGAQTWEKITFNNVITSVGVNSTGTIFVGSDSAYIYRSTNGGQSFEKINILSGAGDSYTINDITFTSSGAVVVYVFQPSPANVYKGIYISTDNGNTWERQLAPTYVSTILCEDDRIYVSFGNGGYGYSYSDDFGNNWTSNSAGTREVYGFYKSSTGKIFIGTYNDGSYVSTDDGNTWSQAFFDGNVTIWSVEGTGDGTIHLINAFAYNRSTDDGVTWNFVNPGPIAQIRAMKTKGNYVFIGYFSSETLYYSQDAGATWGQFDLSGLNSNNVETNRHLELGGDERVYLKTWGGTDPGLYRTINSVLPVERVENIFPEEFSLEQNYPNPFNPSTKISWQSPVSAHQTLKVYDVLGNDVATLVNEEKPAGVYEVEFDPSGLSSGIYFYKLQAGTSTQIKKMILMR